MIKKYRKKPVVIEAIQWIGNNLSEIDNFIGRTVFSNSNDSHSVATSLAVVDLDANTYKKI